MVRPGSTRSGRVAFVAFYVLPLLASAVGLWLVGLPELAAALLAVEGVVLAAMAVVRRPRSTAPVRRSRPWLVPAVMVGALVLITGLSVLAARSG